MTSETKWIITGYEGRQIPNRYSSPRESNDRLALLLPGYAYSVEAPLFHYSARLLYSLGFDVLSVDYRYNESSEYQSKSGKEKRGWLSADFHGIQRSVAERRGYRHLLVVGKSLGTLAMLKLVELPRPWERSAFVWLTPATAEGELLRTLRQEVLPSLVVIGTKDDYYRQSEIEQLSALEHVETKVIEGADHGLELPNDVLRSVQLLPEILDSMSRFVVARFP